MCPQKKSEEATLLLLPSSAVYPSYAIVPVWSLADPTGLGGALRPVLGLPGRPGPP